MPGSISLPITKVGPPPPITNHTAEVFVLAPLITASVTGIVPREVIPWSATQSGLTGGQGTTSAGFTINVCNN